MGALAERSTWQAERQRLEVEVTNARTDLASLDDLARHQSSVGALADELLRQRRLRWEADAQYNEAVSGLKLQQSTSIPPEDARCRCERTRLQGLRAQLARELDLRQRDEATVQDAIKEYDGLRPELQELTRENARLHASLQQSLRDLERIQQHVPNI